MCIVTLNNQLNGVELKFNSKPAQEVLNTIKQTGFRWHNVKMVWYAKQNEKTLSLAEQLKEVEQVTQEQAITTIPASIKVKKLNVKTNMSLWNATQWTEADSTNKIGDTKIIAQTIRKELKARFNNCKFSVRSDYNHVRVALKSSPYLKDSIYVTAIISYIKKYVDSFNYCTSYDPYGDYGSSYSFYSYVTVDYDYTQIEADVTADIADYDKQLKAFEVAEEERKQQEYKEWEVKRELENQAYTKRIEQEKKEIEVINNNVTIKALEENEKYYIIGSQFANLNKNCTLQQYTEEVEKGDFYLQDAEITKELHFDNETYDLFKNMLLNDFDFIKGTGGSSTEDNRIKTMTDYSNMPEDERKTVKFISSNCIAVYCNNELMLVVDAQGYSYARYVGLCDSVTIQKGYTWDQSLTIEQVTEYTQQADTIEDLSTTIIDQNGFNTTWNSENWIEYKDLLKAEMLKYSIKLNARIIQQIELEELKVAMYRLLVEVDGIQDQFKNADIQQGQKITMFYIGDMGGFITSHVTADKVENSKYAQYDNAIKLTFKQPKKHGLYYKHFYGDMLVYDGWVTLPEDLFYVTEDKGYCTTKTGLFLSCDKQQYDVTISHLLEQGIKPIINTHKPIFE